MHHRLKGVHLWEHTPKSGHGQSWKDIMACRKACRDHIIHELGDGASTSLWHDRWCDQSPLSSHVPRRERDRVGLVDDTKVNTMIQEGAWKWPEEWRNAYPMLFTIPVPFLDANKKDRVLWKDNKGKTNLFKTRIAYHDLSRENERVPWGKVVWFSQCIPRHSFTMWLACKGKLLTQDIVYTWEHNENLKCAFCKQQRDSIQHLFFECDYPRKVWNELKDQGQLEKCRPRFNEVIASLQSQNSKKSFKTIIQKLVLGAMLYYVWQERNWRMFQQKHRSHTDLCKIIRENVKSRLLSLKIKHTPNTEMASKVWGFTTFKPNAT